MRCCVCLLVLSCKKKIQEKQIESHLEKFINSTLNFYKQKILKQISKKMQILNL
jgi:hypothetical protein